MRAIGLLGLGAIVACYDPTYRDLACGANGECPEGTSCLANVCVSDPVDASDPDASDPDARIDAPFDTAQPDARVDAAPPDARTDAATDAAIDAVAPCPVSSVTSPTDPTRCFVLVSTPRTWADARAFCIGLGGRLADVRNSTENQALIPLVGTNPSTWLGGSDAVTEGSWVWTDGVPFSFNAWGENQPSNVLGENCLRYVGPGVVGYGPSDWSDQPCEPAFVSICVRAP